jgi:nitric oxide reductase large subunit
VADWLRSQYCARRMQGPAAEKFVVLSLRLLAATFAVVGLLFIVVPNGTLDVLSDFGEWFGNETRAPHGDQQLWLSLGFAYMVVITGICLLAATDVVRYRALLLVLAAGKTASSLATLGFFVFDEQVFAYLLNFLLDGSLVLIALGLWVLVGRIGRPVDPG